MRRTVPIVGPGHPLYEWRPAHLTDIHATFDRVQRALAAHAQANGSLLPGHHRSQVAEAAAVVAAPPWQEPASLTACTNANPACPRGEI